MAIIRPYDGDKLSSAMSSFNILDFLGFTNLNDVLTGITYYPINFNLFKGDFGVLGINYDGSDYPIRYKTISGGGTATFIDVDAYRFKYKEASTGFYLGEKYFESSGSYTDFEPYTQTEVWLPYCGKIELPRTKIVGKYVQIFLYVDFCYTGSAQYVITTSNESIDYNFVTRPFVADGLSFANTEIIATEDFVLGLRVPTGHIDVGDFYKRTTVGIAKSLLGVYAASTFTPSSLIATTTTQQLTTRNTTTGRQNLQYRLTETTSPSNVQDVRNYRKSTIAHSVASSVASLATNQIRSSIANTNNPGIVLQTTQSVHFITTKARLVPYDSNFDKTYGRPLGKSMRLSSIHGFADISSIRLEDEGFSRATENEMDTLETIMLSGVILP